MAGVNGSAFIVDFDGTALSCETDTSSMAIARDMIETTCKDSINSAKTYLSGEWGGTLDATGGYVVAASNGASEVFAAIKTGATVTWKIGGTGTGDKVWSGSGLVSDFSIEAPQNDRVTYSFTITIDGDIAETVVA